MSVSKGVDVYFYCNIQNQVCEFAVPGNSASFSSPMPSIQSGNLQVSSSEISGWDNYTGNFQWTESSGSVAVETQNALINSFDGNLEGGSMMLQMSTPSTIQTTQAGTVGVSYGFYDSGDGASGLSNQDQSWVYVGGNNQNWVGNLMSQNSQAPIGLLVLPGAHDSGMCTMDSVNTMMENGLDDAALYILFNALIPGLGGMVALGMEGQTIMNAAITQKDTITMMLQLGVRYFDFRPGFMWSFIQGFPAGSIYHQHALIPGMAFQDFMQQVVQFLVDNPREIVFINLNSQGFFDSSSMTPSTADLNSVITNVLTNFNLTLNFCGDYTNLSDSYEYMMNNNIRIVFLNQLATSNHAAAKYDSYTDANYGTLDPQNVVKALSGMNAQEQPNYNYTVLQLQDTATSAIDKFYIPSVSYSASPLMATKAMFDSVTLPWVLANALTNLTALQPIVVLNDFIDPYTIDVAVNLSTQRVLNYKPPA